MRAPSRGFLARRNHRVTATGSRPPCRFLEIIDKLAASAVMTRLKVDANGIFVYNQSCLLKRSTKNESWAAACLSCYHDCKKQETLGFVTMEINL